MMGNLAILKIIINLLDVNNKLGDEEFQEDGSKVATTTEAEAKKR
jgi:hypothetical protein